MMKFISLLIKIILGLTIVFVVVFSFIEWYSYIFSRKVEGVIVAIERIETNVTLLQRQGSNTLPSQVFSFAVAIREKSGEIVTSSAEDRQWAVVKKGQCAQAVFYPYPPWKLDKAGTYFNARLDRLFDCQSSAFPEAQQAQPKAELNPPERDLSPSP